ncbi:mucin-2-like isoform X2 [Gouania willdenowi]|uniref:mucin-2-like isoform X2 n=1 Tax=Gouania willdenowi TaxID=441366 RepID=UPI00105684E9|nr:mucin-2-like isoform X2 [Gouania willdenowi]
METPKEPVNAPSLQLCGNCDVAAAAVWCLDCNGGLCDKCELAHRRVSLTRNHRLHNQLVQDKPGPQSKHCDQHPSELLDLICLTCKTFTCKDCQLMNHMNHSYQFVSESMANVKKHMLAAVNPIRAQADTVNRSLRDMETRLKYIEKSKAHLRKDLLHFFNMTIKHLKTKMMDIVREIGEKSNLESKQIVSRMEALKQLQRNHAEIMEACEESQSTTEFWMVLMNWKKIKEILKITRDQDLSPPSTMSHLLVCTQQKTSEIIERMVFLQTGWIPFAVPQEEAIKDNVAQSDTIIPAKSSSSELCSTSSASTSSCSFTSSVLHQNTSTCDADAKQTTSMDSSLLVGGPTNVITDPVVQSSSTTSIATIHAPNKSLPSVCSQKSSSKIQTRRSETDLLGPTIDLSNYSVSYPETIPPPYLSSHCVTSFQTALSPHFQSNSNFVCQTVPNTSFSGSSLSVTNPNATVSKKIQYSPQPVSPNQIANPTQSSRDLTFSKSTTTFAKIPPEVRCPLIAGLLEGSIPKINQPPSVPSHYVNQTCRVQNIQKASRVPDQNLVRAPISTCARATRDSSQHLVQAPTFSSQDFIRTTGVRGLNVAARAPTQAVMVSSPNVVQTPMVSTRNLVQAPIVSTPNFVQALMVSSPNVVQAPMVSSPNFVQALMVSSPNLVQAPMISSPNVVQAPMVSSPNVVQASMVSSPNVVQTPMVSSLNVVQTPMVSCPNVVQAPTVSSPNLVQAPLVSRSNVVQASMISSPNVVQASMVFSPNFGQASMVSSPNLVQAPMVSSPNVVQASMVSSPNVVQTPMVSSLNVVQTPMVSRPNVVQAPTVSSPNLVQAPLVSTSNVVQASMVSSPNVVQAPMVSSPNVVQAPLVSSPNVVQAPMVSSPNVVQAPMVSSPNVVQAPMVSSPNVVQAPMVSSPNVVQAPMVSSPNVVQAPIFPSPTSVQTTGVLGHNVPPMVPTWNVVQTPMLSSPNVVQVPMVSCPNLVQAPMVSSPKLVQTPIFPSPTFVQTTGVLGHNIAPRVPSWNIVQTPMVSGRNVVQPPIVPSPNVFQALQFPVPTSIQAVGVRTQNSVEANTAPKHQAPGVPSPNTVSASVGSLVKTMAPSIPSLGGPCPVLTVPQTELLPNVRALPFNVQGSLVLTNSETLCIPVVPQFPTVALYTLSKNTSLSDDSEDNTSNTLDPVSSGDQTLGCNLHQEDNVDNEPSTTVSEEPEPKPRESTTKVISEPATADNEPTSTVPEDPEPDENEPTTTTTEEYEQITSTYDIKAEDKLSTAERAELGTVIEHQDFKMKLFDPRVSLLRIPVSNHKPGCPLPSFHVVIEESNDQNYLKETEAYQSPTPHPSSDFIDLTDSTDEMDQDCVIMDTVLNSPVEDGLDLMEPLLLPESPFSLEVLSCSVCTSSESLIICSVCARGFHRHCHVPKVKSLSMSSWNCSLCQDLSNQSDPFSSERPAAPEDGLSLQDQRKCETLLLFLKVQTKFPMEQISKRLTLHHPSPYRNVAQFFSDVETMFNDMSQDKASHGLKKRFLEKLKQTFGPEFDTSPLTNEGQAAEKNDQSKQNLRALKRRLRNFLDQQKAKKIKME